MTAEETRRVFHTLHAVCGDKCSHMQDVEPIIQAIQTELSLYVCGMLIDTTKGVTSAPALVDSMMAGVMSVFAQGVIFGKALRDVEILEEVVNG